MILDEIRKQMQQALRDRNALTKQILGVAMGEIQQSGLRLGRDLTDEEAQGVIRKLIKSNEETREGTKDDAAREVLSREIDVLRAYLPRSLSVDDIVAALAPQTDALKATANDGQATGVAMKFLKAAGLVVDGKDVTAAVKRIRA